MRTKGANDQWAAPPVTPSPTKPERRRREGRELNDVAKLEAEVAAAPASLTFFRDVRVEDALAALSAADASLATVIAEAGVLPRITECQEARGARHESNRAFRSLARAIVFQQLNGVAAATIFNRVRTVVGAETDHTALTPAAVAAADDDALRKCGLSQRKLEYLRGLAAAFTRKSAGGGGLSDETLERMSEGEVYDTLVALRGLGAWSVHMFQMFYLNDPDVLPYSDFGVRKGVMQLYRLSAMPSKAKMEEIAAGWAPYRTLASFYMWHVADGCKTGAGKKMPRGEDDSKPVKTLKGEGKPATADTGTRTAVGTRDKRMRKRKSCQ